VSAELMKTTTAALDDQVPGVNVPSSHLIYYVIALAVAGIIHEIGHALAATRCGTLARSHTTECMRSLCLPLLHATGAARTCR
jgi:hypothetical protein